MIVLTTEEAAKARGRSPKDGGHALDPVPLADGRFILGEEVLDDPAHADVRAFLARLPQEEIGNLPLFTEGKAAPPPVDAASLKQREDLKEPSTDEVGIAAKLLE